MDIAQIYRSGILNKGEELTEHSKGTYYKDKKKHRGFIVLTNKRFLFLKKPSGRRAKGLNVKQSYPWGEVMSVSTMGLTHKRLNLTTKKDDKIETDIFSCDRVEIIAQKIVENRNNYVEQKVVEAKTVIIEEANKDKASEILQKRLARGEITVDEFHQKIQRT